MFENGRCVNAATAIDWNTAGRYISLFVIGAIVTALASALRLRIVEPEAVAAACTAQGVGWRCALRGIAVVGFLNNVYGWTALLVGLFAVVSRWRSLALLALISGILGAVLYRFELSGVGLLFGALVWIQDPTRTPLSDADNNRQQQA
jgi:hypothetical protein